MQPPLYQSDSTKKGFLIVSNTLIFRLKTAQKRESLGRFSSPKSRFRMLKEAVWTDQTTSFRKWRRFRD